MKKNRELMMIFWLQVKMKTMKAAKDQ